MRKRNLASVADVRRARNFSNEKVFICDFRLTGFSISPRKKQQQKKKKMMLFFAFSDFCLRAKQFYSTEKYLDRTMRKRLARETPFVKK